MRYNNFLNLADTPTDPMEGVGVTTNTGVATTTTTTTATTGTTAAAVKNDMSGLNSILTSATTLATSAAQIGGAIKQQRISSGRSQTRQERIAACGRKPLFGKAKKEAYNKCLSEAQGGGVAGGNTGGGTYDSTKSLGGGSATNGGGNTKTILIVVGSLLAVGTLGYFLMKRKN